MLPRAVALSSILLLVASCSGETRKSDMPQPSGSNAAATGVSINGLASAHAAQALMDAPPTPPMESSVYYDFDNSLIRDADMPLLQKHAQYLVAHPKETVTIEGNCDERGTSNYNVALGERRALAAKKVLESYGAASSQISVTSYGEERPKATCHHEECWRQNRRGDLVYGRTG